MHYFVSGMGVECCYDNTNLSKVPTGTLQWYIASNNKASSTIGGFAAFEVTSSMGLVVTYFDQDGNVLYTTPAVPPREQQQH